MVIFSGLYLLQDGIQKKGSSYLNYEFCSNQSSEITTEKNGDRSINCSTEDESVPQNRKNVDINEDVIDLLSELISSTEESSCDMDTSHFPNSTESKNVKKTQNVKSKSCFCKYNVRFHLF